MRNPTEMAAVLFCSRSSVYRTVRAYRTGTLGLESEARGRLTPPVRTTVLTRALQRSLLALTLQTKRGITISAGTMRRWLHELGWVWKRAKLGAKDDAPHRVARWARMRWVYEPRKCGEAMVGADELAIHLLPTVGWAWMPKGTQVEVMTPGQDHKHSLAGALDRATGTRLHGLGARKPNALFRDWLALTESSDPAERSTQLYVVVDHEKIHKAKAVAQWLAAHPRVRRLLLPTYCPRAHPIERAFGDVHDCCTRNHQRKR
jgi:putative transposase